MRGDIRNVVIKTKDHLPFLFYYELESITAHILQRSDTQMQFIVNFIQHKIAVISSAESAEHHIKLPPLRAAVNISRTLQAVPVCCCTDYYYYLTSPFAEEHDYNWITGRVRNSLHQKCNHCRFVNKAGAVSGIATHVSIALNSGAGYNEQTCECTVEHIHWFCGKERTTEGTLHTNHKTTRIQIQHQSQRFRIADRQSRIHARSAARHSFILFTHSVNVFIGKVDLMVSTVSSDSVNLKLSLLGTSLCLKDTQLVHSQRYVVSRTALLLTAFIARKLKQWRPVVVNLYSFVLKSNELFSSSVCSGYTSRDSH